MKTILFLLEDYNLFYSRFSQPLLREKGRYQEVLQKLLNERFYQSDSMAAAFNSLGYQSYIIVPECNPLQLRWAMENNLRLYLKWLLERPVRSFKARVLKQYRTSFNSIHFSVLLKQVELIKPDFIYFYSNVFITAEQIKKLKTCGAKVVLQWSCPIWEKRYNFPYEHFDLIVTASPQLADYFSIQKIKVKYLQQAFDSRIIADLEPIGKLKGDVVFIGGFSLGHEYRAEFLEFLIEKGIDITIYGTGVETLNDFPRLQKVVNPPVFGTALYNEYRKYKIAIHIHTTGVKGDGIDWHRFAGAKRPFEITGAGTLLLTSWQENINELFVDGEEVVTFRNKEDLYTKLTFLLSNQERIKAIARAGQLRTIKDHNFYVRAELLEKELASL